MPIPTYIVNLKQRVDRRKSMERQFSGKSEFSVTFVEAVKHWDGAVGLWQSLAQVVRVAKERNLDKFLFCEDDHVFTDSYSKEYLNSCIADAERKDVELLAGGISGYGVSVPVGANIYWVDWYWGNQFIFVYRNMYDKILEFDFRHGNTADGVLSDLAYRKMTMYPFVSVQTEFGYSDITPSNGNKGFCTRIFSETNMRLEKIRNVRRDFNL